MAAASGRLENTQPKLNVHGLDMSPINLALPQKYGLPQSTQNWLDCSKHGLRQRKKSLHQCRQDAQYLLKKHTWTWPERTTVFISDLHADADALTASLLASGGVEKTDHVDQPFILNTQGKQMMFIFGGDFFDKGPSNLGLLRNLHAFIQTGADVQMLAGNHDMRVLFGMRSAGNTGDVRNGHFFMRMGAKAVPFLHEIRDTYLRHPKAMQDIPDEASCMQHLFPTPTWWKEFPEHAVTVMSIEKMQSEMDKIRQKMEKFKKHCKKHDLSMREAYAAALHWQYLFLHPQGEFYWFFQQLRLAYRKGSFLFVHAGIDDQMTDTLRDYDTPCINQQFKQQMQGSPFEFYYGSLANTIRTKYRHTDKPLTGKGGQQARQLGIHAIVHGHRNLRRGQRIALRKQLFHFECDVTLDRCSRQKEGLQGQGAGATLIHPDGYVLGISTDYHAAKLFHPQSIIQHDMSIISGA